MEDSRSGDVENDSPYEIIKHEQPIRTAEEGATLFGIELGQTAPTLIVRSNTDYYALICSGSKGRVDLDRVAKRLGLASLVLAPPKEVQRETGYKVGSVPLLVSLPCILDEALFQYPYVYGGSGVLLSTIKIAPETLEQINQVIATIEL